MYPILFLVHKYSVLLFLVLYLAKTTLLLLNRKDQLTVFSKFTKIPEMIVSFLFLATGIYLVANYPYFNTFLVIKLVAVAASIPLAVIGFKKGNKILASLSLLLIISAYGLAEVNKNRAPKAKINEVISVNSTIPATDSLALGKSIFTAGCQPCHGEKGDANIAGAANLKTSALSEEELRQVIVKGRNSMPRFGYLTESELDAVTGYIKSLR